MTSRCCLLHIRAAQKKPTTTITAQRKTTSIMGQKRPSTVHAVQCQKMQTLVTHQGPPCQRSRTQGVTRQGPRRLLLRRLAAPWWQAPLGVLPFLHLLFRLIFDKSSLAWYYSLCLFTKSSQAFKLPAEVRAALCSALDQEQVMSASASSSTSAST